MKKDTNTFLNELQENKNKERNEIRMSIEDMNIKFIKSYKY